MQLRSILAASAAVIVLAGCGATTLVLPPEQAVNASFSQSDIRTAILSAASVRHWRVVEDVPGRVRVSYPSNERTVNYEATFDVNYSKTGYNIKYVKSYGLGEKLNCNGTDQLCIHRNVSKWVANLNADIQRFLVNPTRNK